MKTIIAAVITCIGLFGLSLGATQYVMKPSDSGEIAEAESADALSASDPHESVAKQSGLPVSFRPEAAVSVEAVVQMSDSIRRMEQELVARETRIAKDEQRIKMLLSDLVTEQKELQAFSEGIDAKIEQLSRLTETLASNLNDLDSKTEQLQALEKSTGTDEESKQKEIVSVANDVKSWFSGLQPDQAALHLKEFANNGKLEFAAMLLQKMPDRQKAKILGSLSDPILVDQLIDSLPSRIKP